MRRLLKLMAAGAAVSLPATLMIIIGVKLSNDALAVIIGLVLGIIASLPVSLIIVFGVLHRDRSNLSPSQPGMQPGYTNQPPVIVVNGGQHPAHGNYGYGSPPQMSQPATPNTPGVPLPGQRQFTVVGEDVTDF